jgi:hypothetical protein
VPWPAAVITALVIELTAEPYWGDTAPRRAMPQVRGHRSTAVGDSTTVGGSVLVGSVPVGCSIAVRGSIAAVGSSGVGG